MYQGTDVCEFVAAACGHYQRVPDFFLILFVAAACGHRQTSSWKSSSNTHTHTHTHARAHTHTHTHTHTQLHAAIINGLLNKEASARTSARVLLRQKWHTFSNVSALVCVRVCVLWQKWHTFSNVSALVHLLLKSTLFVVSFTKIKILKSTFRSEFYVVNILGHWRLRICVRVRMWIETLKDPV